MCKEPGYPCHFGCGMVVAFPEYHAPHCRSNPANLPRYNAAHVRTYAIAAVDDLVNRGRVADRPIGKKRSKMQRSKAPAGKAKR